MNAVDENGNSALHLAVEKGDDMNIYCKISQANSSAIKLIIVETLQCRRSRENSRAAT